jgi:hypothetical protein
MSIDQSVKIEGTPGGSLTIHGSVIGAQGNTLNVGATPPDPGPAGGVDVGQLFNLLTSLRVAAATAADLPPHVQGQLIGCAAEAQRRVTAGDGEGAAGVLLRARMGLDAAIAGSAAGATLRELVETALDLASSAPR